MKACCATYESNSKIYILYKQYISLFTLKYVVDPELSLQKCHNSLKSLFLRVHQISEPNAALWNVGGRRLHVQGRIAKWISPLLFMQSFLQLTPRK